jgi:hypothetical protein
MELQEQVQLIDEIYGEVKKVLVWMGDEDDNIAKIFAFFRTLAIGQRKTMARY